MRGYKGFKKDLTCTNYSHKQQYVIGETVTTGVSPVVLCKPGALHFCKKLKNVLPFYGRNGSHRFCEVEALGDVVSDVHKEATNSLKIIRELTSEEMDKILVEETFNLDDLQEIQKKYPLSHVGGSVGLYLHGIRLKRFKDNKGDIDLVMPYYIDLTDDVENEVDYSSGKNSGNDFDHCFCWNGVMVDVKIDPYQRYESIEYNGFKYKVSLLETIMNAKMKYIINGQTKHKEDLYEICGKTIK